MVAPHYPPATLEAINSKNQLFSEVLIYVLLGMVAVVFIYNVIAITSRHIRFLACLNHDNQLYFRTPNAILAFFKRYILYAPMFGKRHSQPMHIGPIEAGALPTRLQALLLLGIIVMNVTLGAYGIEWHHVTADNPLPRVTVLTHLRNRSGYLAVANLVPLFIMGGRNSPLIALLNVSYNTFNLLHRWFGRIVVSFAIVHVTCQLISWNDAAKKMHMSSITLFRENLDEERFLLWGFVAFISFLTILVTAFSALRHAFYETFWHIHVALAALALGGLYIHLDGLQSLIYIKIAIAFWAIDRFIRLVRILYRNTSFSFSRFRGQQLTRAHIELLPDEAMCVTLTLPRPWTFTPGQHLYVTIPTIGFWGSHPFSIAWSSASESSEAIGSRVPSSWSSPSSDSEKGLPLETIRTATSTSTPQTATLLIRRRSGFTSTLYKRLLAHHGTLSSLPCLIDGPYRSQSNEPFQSSGTVLLFAGGIGITHALPYIPHLLAAHSLGTTALRRIRLIWVVHSPDHLEWIRPYMNEILSTHKRRDVFRIQIYITRGGGNGNGNGITGSLTTGGKDLYAPGTNVQMFPGRPDVDAIVEAESHAQIGAMGVGVCGPGGLADDVRLAVRRRCASRSIEFVQEGFGW